ncbi:RNA recognition domain containing protein [Entamoeba histolytica KU27]|uniref:RNA recognition domain containing protein n=1 Tax=Entamoeba histolytica KU27 TaxID=885311 RepID=M2REJ7_ENTHI|nr:RNA recognition domain containing protein [Entamoeba histolytica KU27]
MKECSCIRSGVFAFKTTQDAVICVSILNNKNENGILLKLAFVSEPPQVSPSNIKYGYSQPHPMSRMSANQPILPAQPITPFPPMLLPQTIPSQNLPPQSLPPQSLPPQNIPSQSVSSQSLPSQSLPPQNLPFQQSQLTNPYSSYKLESQNNNQPYSLNETETTKPIKPPTHYYNYSQ